MKFKDQRYGDFDALIMVNVYCILDQAVLMKHEVGSSSKTGAVRGIRLVRAGHHLQSYAVVKWSFTIQ